MTRAWASMATVAVVALISSCSSGDYEAGDGRYSYLRADFGMVHTEGSPVRADYMVTDGGNRIAFHEQPVVDWLQKPDTVYRALVHYDVSTFNVFSVSQVSVVEVEDKPGSVGVGTDPLDIESAWMDGGFLNIGFAVRTGKVDQKDERQRVGVVREAEMTDWQGRGHLFLRVVHAQNGVPEYYTVHGYMSLPVTEDMRGVVIHLSANTYKGGKSFVFDD